MPSFYHGRKGENIPRGVIRVRVHPSIRVIHGKAFAGCKLLMSVELHDGIEIIGEKPFQQCTSLCEIFIPPDVQLMWLSGRPMLLVAEVRGSIPANHRGWSRR